VAVWHRIRIEATAAQLLNRYAQGCVRPVEAASSGGSEGESAAIAAIWTGCMGNPPPVVDNGWSGPSNRCR
jgi:hypothetical protein